MDISLFFKKCVSAIQLNQKNVENYLLKDTSQKIVHKKRSTFIIKSQFITNQITQLRDLLLQNRHAYLNYKYYISNHNNITDKEREEIDIAAEKLIGNCSELIHELKRELLISNISHQNQEHQRITITLLEEYLKKICDFYTEQKAIRIKNNIEYKNISKIDRLSNTYNVSSARHQYINKIDTTVNDKLNDSVSNKSSKNPEINYEINEAFYNDQTENISPEDMQLFELENEQLYNDLSNLTEEMRQIENQVVHISKLQEVFTEKVLYQNKNLESVLTKVVGSTENVKEANEQIRKAIQRNAGLRVWILFFLLVMSFALIFLDWYNP